VDPDAVPDQPPVVRASDAEREATVTRLQRAVAEGRIDLSEFGERVGAAYAAGTLDELTALVADLPPDAPPPVEIVGTRTPEEYSNVFGDIRVAGTADAPRRVSTVFGDVRLDLRGLRTDADRIEITLGTVFGDVDVVVAEGVDAEMHGRTVFGDRKTSSTRAASSATCGCAAWRRGSRRAGGGRWSTASPRGTCRRYLPSRRHRRSRRYRRSRRRRAAEVLGLSRGVGARRVPAIE
jgi:hypothetical protein